jgi:pimeloyl-ACP methyl ester carboxylesterase
MPLVISDPTDPRTELAPVGPRGCKREASAFLPVVCLDSHNRPDHADSVRPGGSRRLAASLLLAVVPLAAACGGGEGSASQPAATPAPTVGIIKTCLRGAGSPTPFRFTTSAGATLVGVVLGQGRTGLVFGHQVGNDLCEWLPQARSLAKQGYQVLAFDFEGYGDSQAGSGADAGLDTDVVAGAEQLRRRGADAIVLVGSSMGGTAVLAAAARISPPVAGVVSLSGPATFEGLDARAAVAGLRVPVLLVASADDHPFVDDARALYRAARVRDKRLLVVPGVNHGTSMLEFGDDAPKALAALRVFIASHAHR